MHARSLAVFVLLLAPVPGRAAVVVIGNYTPDAVTFSVAEPKAKAREHKLPANTVLSVHVTGPAALTYTLKGKAESFQIDPYNAYVFVADKDGVHFEGVELPGEALERDTKPELNPTPRDPPVKVSVTLFVDDAEVRAEKLWQKELRARFDEASEAIEKGTGIRLEFAGYDTWKSDPEAKNTTDLLTSFEKAVKVKPGALAVGYSSRKLDDKVEPLFGADRGLGGRHILLREGKPRNEAERGEVLAQGLARALGAITSPDPGSAMRDKLGDGYQLLPGAVLRLDPLNALALSIWADERRREPGVGFDTLPAPTRHRLKRVYKALLKAQPGDALATGYLTDLDRDIAKNTDPPPKNPDKPPVKVGPRDELVRQIVKAIVERAKRNTGGKVLTGDALTEAYVQAAGQRAVASEGAEMISAFLIALGLAFDDTGALFDDDNTAEFVKDIETPEERKARVAALGSPTLAGRRDLCRRFFLGCALGELLRGEKAERVAVGRAINDLNTPLGLCFPALASELAGIAFARACQNDAEVLRNVIAKFAATDYLPSFTGLPNGLSLEKFEDLYGGLTDERFVAVVVDIRKRVKEVKAYK